MKTLPTIPLATLACTQACASCKKNTSKGIFARLGLCKVAKRKVGSFVHEQETYHVHLIRGNAFGEMYWVYQLWYQVYVGELHYAYQNEDPRHRIDHEQGLLIDHEPTSWVFVIEHQGRYIGSLKLSPGRFATLSADFEQYLPLQNIYEVCKLMILPQHRDSILSAWLMILAHQTMRERSVCPDWYVCNAKEKLTTYYRRLHFTKLTEVPIVSPLGNLSYLLGCHTKDFGVVVAMLTRAKCVQLVA